MFYTPITLYIAHSVPFLAYLAILQPHSHGFDQFDLNYLTSWIPP